jgi:hypothetical protein
MDEIKQYINYSEAISQGVFNWLDANKDVVQGILAEAIRGAITASTEKAIDQMTMGVMVPVAKFFDCNTEDIKVAIAAAIATSWASRQHPVPK